MFCHNCGNEISTELKFCTYCGAENKNFSQTQVQQVNSYGNIRKTDGEIDRNVLINYLGNLRTLELANSKLREEKNKMERQANVLGMDNYRKPLVTNYLLFWFIYMVCFCGTPYMIGNIMKYSKTLYSFGNALCFISIILGVIWTIRYIFLYIKDSQKYNNCIINENEQKNGILQVLPYVNNDLRQNNTLLDKAYSLNIIPAKYRNIYAIYFLYEYMTTSNATLSEALYQCVLDEISRKLDNVIRQQREAIILSARQNALNEQIVRQNDEILRHAIAIEKNTELSTKYSHIAAINSETVAQIQTYYLFSNWF